MNKKTQARIASRVQALEPNARKYCVCNVANRARCGVAFANIELEGPTISWVAIKEEQKLIMVTEKHQHCQKTEPQWIIAWSYHLEDRAESASKHVAIMLARKRRRH